MLLHLNKLQPVWELPTQLVHQVLEEIELFNLKNILQQRPLLNDRSYIYNISGGQQLQSENVPSAMTRTNTSLQSPSHLARRKSTVKHYISARVNTSKWVMGLRLVYRWSVKDKNINMLETRAFWRDCLGCTADPHTAFTRAKWEYWSISGMCIAIILLY